MILHLLTTILYNFTVVFAVPVWSGVNIAGVRLRDLNPLVGTAEDPEKYNEMHKEVVNRYCFVCLCAAF